MRAYMLLLSHWYHKLSPTIYWDKTLCIDSVSDFNFLVCDCLNSYLIVVKGPPANCGISQCSRLRAIHCLLCIPFKPISRSIQILVCCFQGRQRCTTCVVWSNSLFLSFLSPVIVGTNRASQMHLNMSPNTDHRRSTIFFCLESIFACCS